MDCSIDNPALLKCVFCSHRYCIGLDCGSTYPRHALYGESKIDGVENGSGKCSNYHLICQYERNRNNSQELYSFTATSASAKAKMCITTRYTFRQYATESVQSDY